MHFKISIQRLPAVNSPAVGRGMDSIPSRNVAGTCIFYGQVFAEDIPAFFRLCTNGMGTICLVDNGVFGSVIPQTGNLCREWRRATLGTVLSQHVFVRIGVIHDYAHMERL